MKLNNEKIYNDRWTDWADTNKYGPTFKWLRYLIGELAKEIDKDKISSILDLGCGEGSNTYFLAQKFSNAEVTGSDFSKAAIECANKSLPLENINFIYDKNNDVLKNNYDLITLFEVLEHIDDWRGLLDNLAKSSRGYLMFSFPVGRMRKFEKSVGHIRNFKKGEVEKYLKEKGFMPVKLFYAGFPFYSPLYRELCNIMNPSELSFSQGKFSLKQKLVSLFLYVFFRYFSTKNNYGDRFCGLFVKE